MEYVFDNYKLNRSFTVNGLSSGYYGFAMSSSNPIRYYVTNYDHHKIFVFDEDWVYFSEKSSFNQATYMISIGNNFYITGERNVWKTDAQLNVSITHTNLTAGYYGLYYNSTNNLIYVAALNLKVIQVFSLNIALNDTISTSAYQPVSINGYNYQLYVGTGAGAMLIIVNKQIIQQFNGCNGQSSWLNSIKFDQFDAMTISCDIGQLHLYNTTGSYLNKNIPAVSSAYNIGFDSKSRFVVVTWIKITIYN